MKIVPITKKLYLLKPELDETNMTLTQWQGIMKRLQQRNKRVEREQPEKVWPMRLPFIQKVVIDAVL